ncbi:AMP-binding protein [Falsiroseomonas selenitidurans]|uniref:Long-chain-fatty-acid--CoA ligase n=1 Tax=Falsiroseomonas selenitidurans TaxID=2716335 RepID=A0ABX1E7S9_9PROT|nr:AMP-binding protein [Falsiroseomonas selenitidurans]NKC30970.1 AMP-binding protein [Falsiroseomonas selenitidurans]
MERATTLTELIEHSAATRPDAPAFPGLGWAQAAALVRRLAGGLERAGIGPGDRVAIFLPNRPDFLLLLFALARRGACAILLNTRFRQAELENLLGRAQPVAIAVARDFATVDLAAVLPAPPPSLRLVLGMDGLGAGSLAGLPVLPRAALLDGAEAADWARPEAEALTFTTSGTTAGPKLVLHRQRSLAHHAGDVAAAIGTAAPGAALLAAVPLCGTFGLTAALAALAGAARIDCLERFEAREADAAIRAGGITHMVGGDDLLLKLAEAAGSRPYAPFAFTGFAGFHGQADRVLAESDRLRLAARGVYGSSEAQALFAGQAPAGPHRAVGGGHPFAPAAAWRIAEDGELLLRGPSLFDRYLGNPEATAAARTAEGWFRSGDLAAAQADGGFGFLTRRGDALRIGGFLVSPEEIEGFLQAQPGVAAAQVVEAGGRPVAFVIPGPGYSEAALAAAARRSLARFKQPARIVALAAFPVVDGPNGPKIQRAKLREMAAG